MYCVILPIIFILPTTSSSSIFTRLIIFYYYFPNLCKFFIFYFSYPTVTFFHLQGNTYLLTEKLRDLLKVYYRTKEQCQCLVCLLVRLWNPTPCYTFFLVGTLQSELANSFLSDIYHVALQCCSS